jgi:hypothetical protein
MPVDTRLTPGCGCGWRVATKKVLTRCHRFEVFGVYTYRVLTKMVDDIAVRYRTNERLV